jgi:hypothetical protein
VVVGVAGRLVGLGLGLLELILGVGRVRVTKTGSVVASQKAPGAVCAGVHELMTALLADSIVLSPPAAGSSGSLLLRKYNNDIIHLGLQPSYAFWACH